MYKKLFVIIFVCISILLLDNKKEDTIIVNKEINDIEEYEIYNITMNDLNTKNFEEVFDDRYRILKIYPYVNDIYKTDKSVIKSYTFLNQNISYNINRFTNLYLDGVDKYVNEREKYFISGIPIKKVILYASNYDVDELLFLYRDRNVKASK